MDDMQRRAMATLWFIIEYSKRQTLAIKWFTIEGKRVRIAQLFKVGAVPELMS